MNNLITKDVRAKKNLVLIFSIFTILFFSLYYFFVKNPSTFVQDDLLHQVATAINRSDINLFSRDYLYEDFKTLAYYSPLQIWTLVGLFHLTESVNTSLLITSALYSVIFICSAWLLSSAIEHKNTVYFILVMLTVSQFVSMPINSGYSSGLLRFVIPFYYPYNILVSRALILLFIFSLTKYEAKWLVIQSAILGLIFTFHAPTGLTLSIGTIPYFIYRIYAIKKYHLILQCILGFTLTASPFIYNYIISVDRSYIYSENEKFLLYNFWQFRFPDDYPHSLWKLLTRSGEWYSFFPHLLLVLTSTLLIISILNKNLKLTLISIAALIFYIFGLKSLIFCTCLLLMSFRLKNIINTKLIQYILIIILTVFLFCTCGQWLLDTMYSHYKTPPHYIDNQRFLPNLFPFCIVIIAISFLKIKSKTVYLSILLLSALPLSTTLFDKYYLAYAESRHIKLRAQFDEYKNFEISNDDYAKLIFFAKSTNINTLFLYQADMPQARQFRLDSHRSIAMTFSDMAIKFYSKKYELVKEWPIYLTILESYKTKEINTLCKTARELKFDYVVFPHNPTNQNSLCFQKILSLKTVDVFKLNY